MAVLGQGLVLMVAGMGIVYLFLTVLIFVTKYSSAFVARFNGILPQDETGSVRGTSPALRWEVAAAVKAFLEVYD